MMGERLTDKAWFWVLCGCGFIVAYVFMVSFTHRFIDTYDPFCGAFTADGYKKDAVDEPSNGLASIFWPVYWIGRSGALTFNSTTGNSPKLPCMNTAP